MTAFLATGVTCLVLAIAVLFKWTQLNTTYLLIGSLLYLLSSFGVTMVFNVH